MWFSWTLILAVGMGLTRAFSLLWTKYGERFVDRLELLNAAVGPAVCALVLLIPPWLILRRLGVSWAWLAVSVIGGALSWVIVLLAVAPLWKENAPNETKYAVGASSELVTGALVGIAQVFVLAKLLPRRSQRLLWILAGAVGGVVYGPTTLLQGASKDELRAGVAALPLFVAPGVAAAVIYGMLSGFVLFGLARAGKRYNEPEPG